MANCVNAKRKDKMDKQVPWGTLKLLLRMISYKTFQTIENLCNITMGVIELANQCSLNICLETLFSHSETFCTIHKHRLCQILLKVENKNNSRVKQFLLTIRTGNINCSNVQWSICWTRFLIFYTRKRIVVYVRILFKDRREIIFTMNYILLLCGQLLWRLGYTYLQRQNNIWH